MTDDEPMPTWKLQRELKKIHRDFPDDDRAEEEDLELLRAYDPREWDSIDEFLDDTGPKRNDGPIATCGCRSVPLSKFDPDTLPKTWVPDLDYEVR